MTTTRTTVYRDNHDNNRNRKSAKVTLAFVAAVGALLAALLAAKLYFLCFGVNSLKSLIMVGINGTTPDDSSNHHMSALWNTDYWRHQSRYFSLTYCRLADWQRTSENHVMQSMF
jgi:hypothetical protein